MTSIGVKVDRGVTYAPGMRTLLETRVFACPSLHLCFSLSLAGPVTYRMSGEVAHYMGHLVPPDEMLTGQDRVDAGKDDDVGMDGNVRVGQRCVSYAQLYIYDANDELENCLRFAPHLNQDITQLHLVNPFVRLFCTGAERLQADPAINLRIVFRDPHRRRNRTYNRPAANELGGIIVDDGNVDTHQQDIVIQRRRTPFS